MNNLSRELDQISPWGWLAFAGWAAIFIWHPGAFWAPVAATCLVMAARAIFRTVIRNYFEPFPPTKGAK